VGEHPVRPITARLVGEEPGGHPDDGTSRLGEVATAVGYTDTWFDLRSQRIVTGERKDGGGSAPAGENLSPEG
jgi:hypothetical protein